MIIEVRGIRQGSRSLDVQWDNKEISHSSVKRQEVQLPVSFTENATADLLSLRLPEFKLWLTAELGLPVSYLKAQDL